MVPIKKRNHYHKTIWTTASSERMRLYLLAMLGMAFLCSCATTKVVQSEKIIPNELNIQDGDTSKSKGNEKITLLPHQQLPINYLLQNPDVKGLLINHYMGTGKTYLGIGFGEEFADKDIIILAPRFMEAHWLEHIRQFGAKNPRRYQFVSYADAPKVLLGKNLNNTILIMDEVHNLIRLIKSPDLSINRNYSNLYDHLRSSYKILALSGTPIYNDEYDLAYLMNLVSGKELMPFNEERFRLEYTDIRPIRSFWRGHFLESNILLIGAPIAACIITAPLFLVLGLVAVPIVLGGSVLASLSIPAIKHWAMPIHSFPLRELNVAKFQPLISKYVSFYEIANLDLSDFPSKTLHMKEVSYNADQYWFFLNFAEKSLDNQSLARIYRDIDSQRDMSYITLNSTLLQTRLHSLVGSGREIGNLNFEEDGTIIESPKFFEVLKTIQTAGMPKTVIYSNYFENGTVAFARFLDRQGFAGKYSLLTPDLSTQQFADIIAQYNAGKLGILLLHPEITEGISLKGTRQFHILEPTLNKTLLDQVVARAVRYESHSYLPFKERHVDVYTWKSVVGNSIQTLKLKKANWFKRYGELSDWSDWGPGQRQIDPNFDRKRLSPDSEIAARLESMNQNMDALKGIMKTHSIEQQVRQQAGGLHVR